MHFDDLGALGEGKGREGKGREAKRREAKGSDGENTPMKRKQAMGIAINAYSIDSVCCSRTIDVLPYEVGTSAHWKDAEKSNCMPFCRNSKS